MAETHDDFLLETYRTERLKTFGVWAQVPDSRMRHRPEDAPVTERPDGSER